MATSVWEGLFPTLEHYSMGITLNLKHDLPLMPPTMAVVTAAPVAPMMMTVAAGTPTQAYADELHVLLNMTVMTTSLTQPQQQFQHQQHWGGSNCEE